MALVPFSVSGASASQDLEERLMQVGAHQRACTARWDQTGNSQPGESCYKHRQETVQALLAAWPKPPAWCSIPVCYVSPGVCR